LEASVEGKQNKISKLKIELDGLKEDNREEIKARDKRVRELEKLKSQDDLNDLQETCLSEEAVLIHSIKVKETAIGQSFEGLTECPLCGNEVDSSIQSTWEDEIDDMKKELNEVRIKLDNISESIKLRKNLEKTIEKSKADIRQIASEADSIRKSGSSLTKELEVEKSEMIKAQNKFLSIESEVSGFQDVMDKIQEMDEVLEENHTKVGAQEQTVIHLREQYKKSVDHEREVKKLKDVIETNEEKIKSYKLVKDGFSRYAIPVQLLRNLRNAIEKRATRVFKEFGNGQIKIIDTDGSKSGIEFVLEDENGQRNYKVLSAGEKVMVFVAIRVALTDIVSKARDHKVNFLILDEVAGSLSPNKRESLTRLINKLLRTYFPQVFMVSHVELRDIFNKTLFVEKKNGVSHVQN
jgi:DNA repair exonuclease SbcCD ATPase subunit